MNTSTLIMAAFFVVVCFVVVAVGLIILLTTPGFTYGKKRYPIVSFVICFFVVFGMIASISMIYDLYKSINEKLIAKAEQPYTVVYQICNEPSYYDDEMYHFFGVDTSDESGKITEVVCPRNRIKWELIDESDTERAEVVYYENGEVKKCQIYVDSIVMKLAD